MISQRTEPKTLNPIIALDGSSREIIGLINADLIHINRFSQKTEPALASSWTVSPDSRQYILRLRSNVQFSDGHPFDADDVLFTFQVYLDEKTHSPQRDLLIVAGKPITLHKIDRYTVQFNLEQRYAAAERLFDSIPILPRHLLQRAYEQGTLTQEWSLTTPATQIAGLGPFRVKEYVPGERITLIRNPNYWKSDLRGGRLPYLDEVVALFTGNADSETMRFQSGEIDIINRLSATNFDVLEKHQREKGFRLYDAGPGLEYGFLFFNLNDLATNSAVARRQTWFHQINFRKAVSAAIDREAIVRLAYRGRASPLSGHVTPGNRLWVNRDIPPPVHSVSQARELLRQAGFTWTSTGRLSDVRLEPVTFSILLNAGNPQHVQTATLIQQDLAQIGITVNVVPLEFHALFDRVFKTHDYDAAIMTLAGGDTDPNSDMNVWVSDGSTHVWDLHSKHLPEAWQQEIDRLMQEQLVTPDYARRKRMYDRVQQLVWENSPVICLTSPDVLVGATERLGNFRAAVLPSYTLWDVEDLFLRH